MLPLKALVEPKRGVTYNADQLIEEDDGALAYFNMKSFLKSGGLNSEGTKWYSGRVPPEFVLSEADVIIANTDVTPGSDIIGSAACVPSEYVGKSAFSHHVTRLRVKSNEVSPKFLARALLLERVRRAMRAESRGTTVKMLDMAGALAIEVGVLPHEEQSIVVDILDTLDTAIHQTEAIIAKLKAVKQGLLNDLLTRGIDSNGELRPPQSEAPHLYKESPLGWIPKEWDHVRLDDIAQRGSGHTPSKSVPSYWNGGIKWVSLADSHRLDNIYISETDKEISALGIANSSAVLHPAGTVILSRDAGVGKSAVLACDMAVSQHFMVWRCGDRLHNLFLYFYLQRQKPRFETIALGSTIKTIGLPFFKSYAVAIPPRPEQELASSTLMETESGIAAHLSDAAKLRELKAGLMDDLLTGRVRVTPLLAELAIEGNP